MKFLVDRMLGKLVKGLRMLGYDTLYYSGEDRDELFRLARRENRMILTRNTRLLPEKPDDAILKVGEDKAFAQVKSLIERGDISVNEVRLFSRCLLCNGLLQEIPREQAEGKVPDFVFYHQTKFVQCPQCSKIYWKGSHHQNMERRLKELFQPR